MSLFEGIAESLPTLIDEEDLLFGGGEDLFEFLDDESADEPVAVVSRAEPANYTAPLFFPFGKSEPTPPSLKLSGVSSLKKINSRLQQGGGMSAADEVDAVHELERALATLGNQKRFLSEHKLQLAKWTLDVYGSKLSSPVSPGPQVDEDSAAWNATVFVDSGTDSGEHHEDQPKRTKKTRTISVHVRCKGADKKRIVPLVAYVNHMWSVRNGSPDVTNQREAPCKAISEKPRKRSKPAVTKSETSVTPEETREREHCESDRLEEEQADDMDSPNDDTPDSPGRIWSWLEDCSYFSPISTRQPLAEDLTLEAEGRLGRSTLIPLEPSGGEARTASENHGVTYNATEKDADTLKQRLLSALMAPSNAGGAQCKRRRGGVEDTEPFTRMQRADCTNAGPFEVLDVTRLSLEQRIFVQLCGVGLCDGRIESHQIGSRHTEHPDLLHSQRNLAEKITKLNRRKVALRREIKAVG